MLDSRRSKLRDNFKKVMEEIKLNSAAQRMAAIEALKKAKEQETKKRAKGFRYVKVSDKTFSLLDPNASN